MKIIVKDTTTKHNQLTKPTNKQTNRQTNYHIERNRHIVLSNGTVLYWRGQISYLFNCDDIWINKIPIKEYTGDENTSINQPQGHAGRLGTNLYEHYITVRVNINTWCLSEKGRSVAAVVSCYCFIIVTAVIDLGLRSIVSVVWSACRTLKG